MVTHLYERICREDRVFYSVSERNGRSKSGKSRYYTGHHVRDMLVGRCILERPVDDAGLTAIGLNFTWDERSKSTQFLSAQDVKVIVFGDSAAHAPVDCSSLPEGKMSRASCIVHRASCIVHRASCIVHRASCMMCSKFELLCVPRQ
jgi:hypothetical protein